MVEISSDEQKRFVGLYIHFSKNFDDYKQLHKNNRSLAERVADLCAQTLKELAPAINSESYNKYAKTRLVRKKIGGVITKVQTPLMAQTLLEARIVQDPLVRSYTNSLSESEFKDYCYNLSYGIADGYLHFLQRKLMPKLQQLRNICQ